MFEHEKKIAKAQFVLFIYVCIYIYISIIMRV